MDDMLGHRTVHLSRMSALLHVTQRSRPHSFQFCQHWGLLETSIEMLRSQAGGGACGDLVPGVEKARTTLRWGMLPLWVTPQLSRADWPGGTRSPRAPVQSSDSSAHSDFTKIIHPAFW